MLSLRYRIKPILFVRPLSQSKRNSTTKCNILFAGASPTHFYFRSRCCDSSDPLLGMSFGLPRRLLTQLSMHNTTSMRFLHVPANRGFFIQKRRCSPLVKVCFKHPRHLKTLVISRALLDHHTETKKLCPELYTEAELA